MKVLSFFIILIYSTINGQEEKNYYLKNVFIVSKVYDLEILNSSEFKDTFIADDEPKYPVQGKEIAVLGAIIELERQNNEQFYIVPEGWKNFTIKEKENIPVREWNKDSVENSEIKIEWFKIEPDRGPYSNEIQKRVKNKTVTEFRWDKIKYNEILWDSTNKFVKIADISPVYLDKNDFGTMRYKVVVKIGAQEISSGGKEVQKDGDIQAHRISYRLDDENEVISWAGSFFNLPYIWGSASLTGKDKEHQTEKYIGSDCADFVVGSARKAGYNIKYTGTAKIKEYCDLITKTYIPDTTDEDSLISFYGFEGYYLDENKNPIPFDGKRIKRGDLVLWKRHIGILYEDKSAPEGIDRGKPNKILDKYDLMLHTLFHEPEIAPLNTYSGEFEVIRFKIRYSISVNENTTGGKFLKAGLKYLDVPFEWEGRSRNKLDCLGLLFLAYKDLTGRSWLSLSVYPSELVESGKLGRPVNGLDGVLRDRIDYYRLKKGDVIYFLVPYKIGEVEPFIEIDNIKYWVWHTGIYAGEKDKPFVLHAKPGYKVVVELMDEIYFSAIYATRFE